MSVQRNVLEQDPLEPADAQLQTVNVEFIQALQRDVGLLLAVNGSDVDFLLVPVSIGGRDLDLVVVQRPGQLKFHETVLIPPSDLDGAIWMRMSFEMSPRPSCIADPHFADSGKSLPQ